MIDGEEKREEGGTEKRGECEREIKAGENIKTSQNCQS
jgi:hypothetical protein